MDPCAICCGAILKVCKAKLAKQTKVCFCSTVNLRCFCFLSDTQGWGVSPRGAGYLFGSDVVAQFNSVNDIDMICRAHQLVMEGYKWHFNETVLTVWSAPNYCYRCAIRLFVFCFRHLSVRLLFRRCGNVAAILELNEHLQRDFTIFEAAPQETRGIPSKKPQADYFL